jgi:predicted nucleotidyltransferase
MRLKPNEIAIIKSNILKHIDDAHIILFGSRVDDTKKGGDIDICVETNQQISLKQQMKILTDIKMSGIERKVDMILKTPTTKHQPIFQTIHQEGIVL